MGELSDRDDYEVRHGWHACAFPHIHSRAPCARVHSTRPSRCPQWIESRRHNNSLGMLRRRDGGGLRAVGKSPSRDVKPCGREDRTEVDCFLPSPAPCTLCSRSHCRLACAPCRSTQRAKTTQNIRGLAGSARARVTSSCARWTASLWRTTLTFTAYVRWFVDVATCTGARTHAHTHTHTHTHMALPRYIVYYASVHVSLQACMHPCCLMVCIFDAHLHTRTRVHALRHPVHIYPITHPVHIYPSIFILCRCRITMKRWT